jgi:hypothetical protein
MRGGGDVKVNRGARDVRRWKVPPPLRHPCGGTGRFRLSHRPPNVPNALNANVIQISNVLNVITISNLPNVQTNARRAAPRPYSKGSDRAGGLHGNWRWEPWCGREHVQAQAD